jgi:3-deoxy-7-phosphoheptulonate synthase
MIERTKEIDDLHIIRQEELPTPEALKNEFQLRGAGLETVLSGHRNVKAVLDRSDPRLVVVVGPCSIHSPEEAIEYAKKIEGTFGRTVNRAVDLDAGLF